MKQMLGIAVAVVLLAGAYPARAGSGCCAGASKTDASAKMSPKQACSDLFAQLNLTDDQKAKVAALQADCEKTGCDQKKHAKFMSGIQQILTPDQYSQWQANCQKARKDGVCPAMKSAAKDSNKI